jgi:pimeloyl-ACP methyl ester carboxylesterase
MVRFRIFAAITASVLTLNLAFGLVANATTVPPEYLPTPVGDAFYNPPAGYETSAPGTILKSRDVTTANLTDVSINSYQMLVRTNDSKNQPTATVSTLIVPTAAWTGEGSRPVMDYSMAEDSLGLKCATSYNLAKGEAGERDYAQYALEKGYAFLTTDHEGPKAAYAAGRLAGQSVLDGIRAAKQFAQGGVVADAPVVVAGYSGGAIAAGWAAQLAPTYAPDVELKGAIIGGTPADMKLIAQRMNGGIGASYFLAASFGVAREYPEMLKYLNFLGRNVTKTVKDFCKQDLTYAAVLTVPLQLLTTWDIFYKSDVKAIFNDVSLGNYTPNVPVYAYHGNIDEFMPLDGVKNLKQKWCNAGVQMSLDTPFGGHAIGEMTGRASALQQATAFLEGDGQLIKPSC